MVGLELVILSMVYFVNINTFFIFLLAFNKCVNKIHGFEEINIERNNAL